MPADQSGQNSNAPRRLTAAKRHEFQPDYLVDMASRVRMTRLWALLPTASWALQSRDWVLASLRFDSRAKRVARSAIPRSSLASYG